MLTYLTGLTYLKIGFANNRNVVGFFLPPKFSHGKKITLNAKYPTIFKTKQSKAKQNKIKQNKQKAE